jgi:hypothetical protein
MGGDPMQAGSIPAYSTNLSNPKEKPMNVRITCDTTKLRQALDGFKAALAQLEAAKEHFNAEYVVAIAGLTYTQVEEPHD